MNEPIKVNFSTFDSIFEEKPDKYKEFLEICLPLFQKANQEIQNALVKEDFSTISKYRHSISPTLQSFGAAITINNLNKLKPNIPLTHKISQELNHQLGQINHQIKLKIESL